MFGKANKVAPNVKVIAKRGNNGVYDKHSGSFGDLNPGEKACLKVIEIFVLEIEVVR